MTLNEKDYIYLSEEGTVERADLLGESTYKWKKYTCKGAVHFYPNGNVKMCPTADKVKFKGKKTPMSVTLCFDESGARAKKNFDALCADWNAILN